MKLYEQLQAARAEMPVITFDGSVNYTTSKGSKAFKYATLPNIINTITPILLKHNIYFAQLIDTTGVRLLIYNKDGEELDTITPIVYVGANPQDWGSAITYTKRYQLASAFGIVAEQDDDGQRAIAAKPPKPVLALNDKKFRALKLKIEKGDEVDEDLVREHFEVTEEVLKALFEK